MALEFLKPLNDAVVAHAKLQPKQTIAKTIRLHTATDGLPDLSGVKLVVIGVLENRRDANALFQVDSLDQVREKLYELYPGNWTSNLADLGDVHAGDTVEDTYYVVNQLTAYFLRESIIPIFLGGSQDLMYPIYRAFDEFQHMINVVNVDCRFDLGDIDLPITSRSYIGKMITVEPYNLFNYSNLGFQTYFNSQEEIDLLDRMYFDAVRLGHLDNDITLAESVLRDADVVGVDMSVVRASDVAFAKANPNGLDGKQICSLSRYSGISDRLKAYGIFEINSERNTGSQLVAEMIWYFMEGYNYRSFEYPVDVSKNCLTYKVPVENEILTFYKSTDTGRWWIELPFISLVNNKLKQHTLLPCDRRDYEMACDQVLPDRWLKARRKNEI
ncbi:arginase [Nonlabens sp. MB-3u-79]|jgi:formiminoglutamase|uniref:formimidoylglutamase n=1 Tax=Nonlabens sp. MB-3u-79 TaxID=2058134 RepID=UPI000C31A4CF|nr:formimidoylglutamase [Nonlabens sp. MB-3u-79]AUC79096.1 arginase [Nonlabens sp. MB-3u-79]|tara:strand:+ start:308 stop:1465 length:1158 start_codon:yes stop_codon:yes gene_type:complete